MRRIQIILGVVVMVIGMFASPALATSEGGWKSCSASSHVYTKGEWKTSYSSWLDITADGIREKVASDVNAGNWETDYMNTWASVPEHGAVVTTINSAYYSIFGSTLDTWLSWPGCQAD